METVKSQQAAQNVNNAFVPGVKAEAALFLVAYRPCFNVKVFRLRKTAKTNCNGYWV